MKSLKFISILTAIFFSLGSNVFACNEKLELELKFDFGSEETEGFEYIPASLEYSEDIGYGFNTPENIKNVSASGENEKSDGVRFLEYGTKSENTFNVDLPIGLYEVEVVLGDTSRSSVAAEGVFQLINLTGNNAVDKFQIPITDGQLNILVTAGKEGKAFTISSLDIKMISKRPVTNKSIYLGGDSTMCNYYPLNDSNQTGWGQMFSNYIDEDHYQIRNMASGGQIARGFRDGGQFEAIMKYLTKRDVVMLEFGINDVNAKNNETEEEYKEIMVDMINKVKGVGAKIIILTPHGRLSDFNDEGVHYAENKWYRNTTIEIAEESSIPLIDINTISSELFTLIGEEEVTNYFVDNIHFSRLGGDTIAKIVASDMKKQRILRKNDFINISK